MDIKTMLQPQAAECLQAWHAMIAQRDLSGLPELLHPRRCSARRWLTSLMKERLRST